MAPASAVSAAQQTHWHAVSVDADCLRDGIDLFGQLFVINGMFNDIDEFARIYGHRAGVEWHSCGVPQASSR